MSSRPDIERDETRPPSKAECPDPASAEEGRSSARGERIPESDPRAKQHKVYMDGARRSFARFRGLLVRPASPPANGLYAASRIVQIGRANLRATEFTIAYEESQPPIATVLVTDRGDRLTVWQLTGPPIRLEAGPSLRTRVTLTIVDAKPGPGEVRAGGDLAAELQRVLRWEN
jgi:hypothetical protein